MSPVLQDERTRWASRSSLTSSTDPPRLRRSISWLCTKEVAAKSRPKQGLAATRIRASWPPSSRARTARCTQHVFNLGSDSPRALCLPDPPPTYHLIGMAKIVQTPALTVIINEGVSNSNTTRMIFTDGRGLPEEMSPTWLGYSVGRWEGDTLVVTTAGFNDRTWLDFAGHPHSEALRITERFHRRDFGHMDFEMTLDDPKTFTRSITFRADKTLAADTEIMETICENRDTALHMKGVGGYRLTPEALAKYAGAYEFAPGREAVFTVDGPTLILKLGGQRAQTFTMLPESETTFVATGFGERARFDMDSSGAITGFTFITGTGSGLGDRPASMQKAVRTGAAPGAR